VTLDDVVPRLLSVTKNALLWAVAWAGAGFVLHSTLCLAGVLPPEQLWLGGLIIGFKMGTIGIFAGAAVPWLLELVYRGRPASRVGWLGFGLAGAVVTALFVPVFLQAMNLLSGDGLVPMALVLDDSVWAAFFGGAAAIASLKLVRRSSDRGRGARSHP
jgi:hypothetical protein